MSGPIIITGVAGFIGSHVAEALLERGERVVGVDNFDAMYGRDRKEANLAELHKITHRGAFDFIEADFTNAPAMFELARRVRPGGVVHLGARAGVRRSIEDPIGYAHVNVTGTAVMLEAARQGGASRMVIASSSSVYGNNVKTPFSEEDDVGAPISPYAATKRACELIAHTHWHLTTMPTACLRFFTVFGPRQRPDLAMMSFFERLRRGETITMFGDGSTSRDYTYIDDIVAGVLAAYDRVPEFGFRVWNLGGNHPVSLREMIAAVGTAAAIEPRIERKPMQPGDVERTWADLSRSSRELGYTPRTSLADGLAKQWAWLTRRG